METILRLAVATMAIVALPQTSMTVPSETEGGFPEPAEPVSDTLQVANEVELSEPSPELMDMVTFYEGFSDTAYLCPAGKPTIGYGRRVKDLGIVTDKETEYLWLKERLASEKGWIMDRWPDLEANRIEALTSLSYNIGMDRLLKSRLCYALDNGLPVKKIHFSSFRTSGGKVLDGLVRRRDSEWNMWNK